MTSIVFLHSPMNGVMAIAAGAGGALAVAFALSLFFVWRGFLPDRPNARSSHRRVTPRSGGVAIYLGWALAMTLLAFQLGASARGETLAFAALAGAAMLLGLADDRYAPPTIFKFSGQIICASAYAWLIGSFDAFPAPIVGMVDLGPWAFAVTVLWIVAFMNVFNFMDGANGVAATTGVIVACALAAAAAFLGALVEAVAGLALAFALAGFLRENFPHGRIFMGDGGSQCAGFILAALGVSASNASDGAVSALFAATAAAAFLFDVGFTLCHRAVRGEAVFSAHREHLYQLLLRLGASHVQVAGLYSTATALCASAAIWMLCLPPDLAWIAPSFLAAAFLPPAFALYRRSRIYGLLPDAAQAQPAPRERIDSAPFARAAE